MICFMIRGIKVSLLAIISVALISTSLPIYSFAAEAPAPMSMTPPEDPNADITITCTKGSESKQVTGKSPVQCPTGYQMQPMQPMQPGQPQQPAKP